jgi:hypothetical protein
MTRTTSLPFFDGIMAWSIDHPLPRMMRYLLAILAILVIAVIRAMVVTTLVPWLLFVPAVVVIGLTLAKGRALLASVLATVAAALSIGSSAVPMWLTGPQWGGSLLFLSVGIGLSFLTDEVRTGLRRVRLLNNELADREAFLTGVLASSTTVSRSLISTGG